MRVILIIGFILQVSFGYSQQKQESFTLDEALKFAFTNNPSVISPAVKKNLSFEIKSAWYLWIYRIHKWQTIKEYEAEIADLNRIASLRYQEGDYDFSEASAIIGKLADIETSDLIVANETVMSMNLICQLLYTELPVVPSDTNFILYEINKDFDPFMMDTSVNQSDSAFARYTNFIRQKSIENMQLELDNLFIKLQYFYSFGLPHAETIIHTAQTRFKSEEIDYIELSENLAEAYKIRLEYLETLNTYNQSAIQLENYAY